MFGAVLNRLATSVRRALSKYAVGTQEPELAFDFIDNEYITNNSTSNFASAITHSRSGNATMTDGYGPELVANGGFDSGTDGWSVAGTSCTLSYDNGKAQTVCTGTDGNSRIGRSVGILTAGTAYIFTLQYYEASSYGFIRVTSGSITGSSIQQEVNTTNNGNRRVTMVFVPSTTQEYFVVAGGNFTAGSVSTFDNVSVREMPVLKWAPHNLALYSEQFDNAVWAKIRTTVAANQITAPDGTTTADKIIETAETGNHFIVDSSSVSFSVGQIGTSAVFLKAGERSAAVMQITDPSSPSRTRLQAIVDLSAGTITTQEFNSPTDIKSSITDAGNGWYLVKLSMATKAAGPMECLFGPLDSTSYTSNLPSYTGDGSSGIYAWGAHIFRSDLGGMVDNPDRGDSYVPTTSSAKYLPRIGHHVYNGSAWVNEGLLAESEARTNIVTYSNELSNANWTKINATVTANSEIAPDGNNDAFELAEEANTNNHFAYAPSQSFTSGNAYTISAFIKAGTKNIIQLAGTGSGFGTTMYGNFDLANGVVGSAGSGVVSTIEDVGNGWYRCAITGDATSTASGTAAIVIMIDSISAGRLPSFTGSASNNVYVYGFQTEQAATPSSYIPTDSATVTRAAETFTIPSANLPWPSPNYIGSELVTNGDGSSTTNWSAARSNSTLTVTGGRLRATAINAGAYGPVQTLTGLTIGNVYQAKADVFTSGGSGSFYFRVVAASDLNATAPVNEQTSVDKSISVEFVATATTMYVGAIHVASAGGDYVELDNVSVREINPLSVSIAMDGRMTYADTGVGTEVRFNRWYADSNNYIITDYATDGGNDRMKFEQRASGTIDNVQNVSAPFSPDILVPFNIASRHGSTFINGAVDGVALTVNTTPTALPDLSATDLSLAYDYMGTVGTFRVWDKDLGDDGIVEATNPSLEPSLSLTFEGTGTNSFVVNDWSE